VLCDHLKDKVKDMVNLLLAVSGSVAAIKAAQIVSLFKEALDSDSSEIRVIVTEHASHFIDVSDFDKLNVKLYRDCDEWSSWNGRGDPVLHIELRKWADVMVIAPLSANTLAKLANGLCDNLLTCVARAWDFDKKIFFAPAMNTLMWDHPVTSGQTWILNNWGYTEIPPISKTLMCNDTGMGAMAEPQSIVDQVLNSLKN